MEELKLINAVASRENAFFSYEIRLESTIWLSRTWDKLFSTSLKIRFEANVGVNNQNHSISKNFLLCDIILIFDNKIYNPAHSELKQKRNTSNCSEKFFNKINNERGYFALRT